MRKNKMGENSKIQYRDIYNMQCNAMQRRCIWVKIHLIRFTLKLCCCCRCTQWNIIVEIYQNREQPGCRGLAHRGWRRSPGAYNHWRGTSPEIQTHYCREGPKWIGSGENSARHLQIHSISSRSGLTISNKQTTREIASKNERAQRYRSGKKWEERE